MRQKKLRRIAALALAGSLVAGLVQVPGKSKLSVVQAADSVDYEKVMQEVETRSVGPVSTSNDDWLHVEGSDIKDQNGNVVRLTGANWFGYNCCEKILHGLGWGVNMSKVLKECADRGINLLRIPVSTEILLDWKYGREKVPDTPFNADGFNLELVHENGVCFTNLEVFDALMAMCKENGIKIMVDVHSAEANNAGHNYPLWYNTGAGITTEDWIEGWEWLVERYKNDDTLIACDLKNEPHGKVDEGDFAKWDGSEDINNWRYAAIQCAEAILKINPNLLIMVEGVEMNPKEGCTYDSDHGRDWASEGQPYYNFEGAWWGGNLRMAKEYPIEFENNPEWNAQVVYSPHDYGPLVYAQKWFDKDFTEETLLEDYWYDAWAYLVEEDIAPLLMGEWGGFMDGGDNEKWMNLIADYMNKKNISHTFWCLNPNSGDTGGLLNDDWKTWDEEKYALFERTVWQDENGKYIGLDHAIALGANGITVAEYYNEEPTSVASTESRTTQEGQTTIESSTEKETTQEQSTIEVTTEKITEAGQITTAEQTTEDKVTTEQVTETKTTEDKVTTEEVTEAKTTEDKVTTEQVTEAKTTEDKVTTEQVTEAETTEDKVTTEEVTEAKTTEDKVTTEEVTEAKTTEDKVTTEKVTEEKTTTETGTTKDKTTTENGTTEEKTTTEKTTEIGTTEGKMTTEKTTEIGTTEGKMTTEKTTEIGTTEGKMTTEKTTEIGTTEGKMTTEKTTEIGTTEEKTTEERTTENRTTEGKTTEERTTEIRTTEGKTTEERTTEIRTTEEKITTEQTTEEQVTTEVVKVESISLEEKTLELTVGGYHRLSAIVLPENAKNKNVIWSVDSGDIVSVDTAGIVTAIKEGTAIVTATTADGQKTASCMVTVKAGETEIVPVESIIFNTKQTEIEVGEQFSLTATVLPVTATDKSLIWSSDCTEVATVDQEGNVTAKSAGNAVITAKSKDGKVSQSCYVTVKEVSDLKVNVESIELNPENMTMKPGETKSVNVLIFPSNATNQEYTLESSNPSVAVVDSEGQIMAVRAGETIIFATAKDGGKTAQCKVVVEEDSTQTEIAVSKVTLSEEKVEMTIGNTKKLIAGIEPVDATNQTIIWKSNDENVASVDSEGNVVAVGEGYTSIVATASNGQFALCTVKVTKNVQTTEAQKDIAVEEIGIGDTETTLVVGKTQQLEIEVLPETATNKKLVYTSTNSKVVSVSSNGLVRAIAPGKASIVIKAEKGTAQETITFTVVPGKVSNLQKKSVKKTSMKLVWKKQKSVSGYKVYIYKGGKYKLYKTTKVNYVTAKKLKANTTYRFKVKAYKKIGSKTVYGAYSNVLKVRTKR